MNVSVEAREGLERRVVVTFPSQEIHQKVTDKLREAARGIRLPGFRPGKVPLREVRRRFGAEVTREATGELVQRTLTDALTEQELAPAGTPKIEVIADESAAEFSYAAEFEVFPEVELADLGTLAVERPTAEVIEEDIDAMLETMRERRSTFETAERPAEDGDQVKIRFEGRIDGELFEGGSTTDEAIPLVLGSGSMIEGFEAGLVGASAGETRSLDLQFPEDYGKDDLAGKAVVFEVTVEEVSVSVVPEIDEEFAKAFGVESGDLDEMRQEVRASMERELESAVRGRVRQNVVDALVASHQALSLPEALVREEVRAGQMRAAQQFGLNDPSQLPPDLFDKLFESQADALREDAEKRVRAGLVFNEIRNSAEIEVDGDRVRAEIERMAAAYEQPEAVLRYYYGDEERLASVENSVLEEQLVDHILEAAQVTEVTSSYGVLVRGESEDGAEAET